MTDATPLMTAEDLMANPVPNKRTELVAGRLLCTSRPDTGMVSQWVD
jgi:hypothetical protein